MFKIFNYPKCVVSSKNITIFSGSFRLKAKGTVDFYTTLQMKVSLKCYNCSIKEGNYIKNIQN